MHSAQIGRITVTRFAYGIPVNIKESQDAGHAVVLTTIGDNATHFVDATRAEAIAIGESSAVDCSRTDYNVDFDPDHLQLNLTIPHSVLERVCRDWFGFVPDNVLCQYKTRIGGNNSSWLALADDLYPLVERMGQPRRSGPREPPQAACPSRGQAC
ncbi:hypothetical protein [Bradyrhizobium sp. USDA 336]|uniref:hypothetical protein n=1 Tax=Bradyrhizobium sp. USDA 336 TaxID=3156311 RepID=UPI003832BD99